MEETRRKNEASMARKRLNNAKGTNSTAAGAVSSGDSTNSPSSTGAMDSLLEKLRAAAPQARDQRDRRRRARLRDRHQIRVASGQAIPDLSDLTKTGSGDEEGEKGSSNMESRETGDAIGDRTGDMAVISESEDVAERAATLLQGLRGDGDVDGSPGSRDGSLRARRRRESANDERRSRRRRRGAGSTTDGIADDRDSPTPSTTHQDPDPILEEPPSATTETPASPRSPKGTQKNPLEID